MPSSRRHGRNAQIYLGLTTGASADFSGFLDAGTSQTYVAASDGLPRNMYLYWDAVNDPSSYFYGTVLCDFSADGAVSGPVNFKATWAAAGPVVRYTQWGGIGT